MQCFWLGLFCFLRLYLCFKMWALQTCMTVCYWRQLGGEGGCEEQLPAWSLLTITYQLRGLMGRGSKVVCFALCMQNELQIASEEVRAFVLHVWFLTTELWRKMSSVNAVIWLHNTTDCSGSGKVTYLLGWHDWPMSADVWGRASFWSAAAQLCPWAVLAPVQKPGDFYLPISAYSLYPDKFLIYLNRTPLTHSVNIGMQIYEIFLLVGN